MFNHQNLKANSQPYIKVHNYMVGQLIGKGSFENKSLSFITNNTNNI